MLMVDLLEQGLILFNKGQFYEAHEVWEDLWRETDRGPLRTCYQGLIQAAVGLHHLGRRNTVGARSQLGKSIRNLQSGAGKTTGLDIEMLIRQLSQLLEDMPDSAGHAPRITRIR
jgi:hypothetical protein